MGVPVSGVVIMYSPRSARQPSSGRMHPAPLETGLRSSVSLGTAFSFLYFCALFLPPSLLTPSTKEASKLLLEIQISIHLTTQLRNSSAPLGISTCMHVRLKHTMSRIVCSTHVQVHAHRQCSICAGTYSNRELLEEAATQS